jgi:hypothetical protein
MNIKRMWMHGLMLALALLLLVLMLLWPVSAPSGLRSGPDAFEGSVDEPAYGQRLPSAKKAIADARNGPGIVAGSLMVAAVRMGMDFRLPAPASLQPETELAWRCREIAGQSGTSICITEHIDDAVEGVDLIYADLWLPWESRNPRGKRGSNFSGAIR